MAKKPYSGFVVADLFEVRFAFSGKVVSVRKKTGDAVKKWEAIASLDRKSLQTELDRQLADYEKARAGFELFRIKHGEGGDDTVKFLRQGEQAQLNASVKEVELAKYKLDSSGLISPVNGVIVDMGGLAAGMYVTPGSFPVKVIDHESLSFRFTIEQDDLAGFREPIALKVTVGGLNKEYAGTAVPPVWGKDGRFDVTITFEDRDGLIPGMKGEATIP